MLLVLAGFSLSSIAQTTVQVGSGTATSSYLPIYTCYGYNYSQVIYTAADLTSGGAAGASIISKIRYKQTNTTAAANWISWTVYIGNTANASFASSSSWIPTSAMTQVFSGNITQVTGGGWMEITLANPFVWDGSSNLVVAVDENTPNYACTATWQSFTSTPASGSRSLLYYNDNTNPDPAAPLNANRALDNNVPQIQFEMTPNTTCSGTPTPGSATASPATACLNANVSLSVTGATSAGGLTFQWQSSPAGQNNFTNIAGATGSSYSYAKSSTDYDYRRQITCAGNTATSSAVSVTLKPFYNCYCASAATSTSYEDIFNVTVNGVSNSSTCTTTGGAGSILNEYSDYSGLSPIPLVQGNATPFSVQIGFCGSSTQSGVAIFIDYDHDGTFTGVGETVYASGAYAAPTTYTGTFTVPISAPTGITRMRIINAYYTNGTSITPCLSYFGGETEDYLVTVSMAMACTGTPQPGNTVSSVTTATSGTPFTLSLQNIQTTSGITYQWRSSTNGTAFFDIAGATNSTYTTTQNGANTVMYYRAKVTCANSGNTGTSVPVQVNTQIVYCVPTSSSGCTDGDVIARVVLNTLDNNSGTGCPSGAGGNGYSDYTTNPALTTTLSPATTYGLTVYAGQYSESYAAWIDYNDDGVFDNVTERVGFSNGTVAGSGQVGVLGSSATFPIVLSCTPPAGVHRLRVRAEFALSGGSAVTPCNSNAYSEVEDYNITITAAPSCLPSGVLSVLSTGSFSADLKWAKGCSSSTMWDIEYGAPNHTVGTGTIVTVTADSTYTVTGLNSTTTYDFYIRANCGGNGTSTWSLKATGTTLLPPCSGTPVAGTASSTTTNACPSQNFTITATGYTADLNMMYQWEVSTDGGATFTAISGATNAASISLSQTVASQYRLMSTCTNSGLSNVSNSVSIGLSPFLNCYCATTNAGTALIFELQVRDQVVNTSATNPTASPYYTLNTTDTFKVRAGATFQLTVKMGPSSPSIVSVWIDYNQDGIYSSSEFNQVGTSIPVNGVATILVNVPATATQGVTGFRIRSRAAGNPNGATDACSSFGSGETEDYRFNILPACTKAPAKPGKIIADTTLKICGGESRTYSIAYAADADYYYWTVPTGATITSGQGTDTIHVSYSNLFQANDIIAVRAINSCDTSANSSNYNAQFRGAPKKPGPLTANDLAKICPGETRTYHFSPVEFAQSYTWSSEIGVVASGQNDTMATIIFTNGFVQDSFVQVTATNGCGTSDPRIKKAKFRGAPKAPKAIYGNLSGVCNMSGENYTVLPSNGATSYNWAFSVPSAQIVAGQTTGAITASFNGSFSSGSLNVVAVNGCGYSPAKTVDIVAGPGKPTITGNATACANSTESYTATVHGASSFIWQATGAGSTVTDGINTGSTIVSTYSTVNVNWGSTVGLVYATPINSCDTGTKGSFKPTACVAREAVSELATSLSVDLVPNPASEQVTIRVNNSVEATATVRVLSVTGQQMMSEVMPSTQHGSIVLPISNLASGMYMVEVTTADGQKMTKQLIKN